MNSSQLDKAAGWYKRYYEMAPGDLLGLKKLTEVRGVGQARSDGAAGGTCGQDRRPAHRGGISEGCEPIRSITHPPGCV